MTSPNISVAGALMALKQVNPVSENLSQENLGSAKKVLAKLSGTDFEYWIRKDKVTIGRNSSHGKVDVNVEMSSYVSRKHLQINYERGRFFLVCLGKNGVFVNGQFHRLGASPFPLDKACYIRFPSTSIRLNFEPHPNEIGNTNGEANQLNVQTEAKYFPDDNSVKTVQSSLAVPPLMHSKSLSPIDNPQIDNKYIKHEFSSPSLKYVIPRDPRGFLSAPPSPTGTISAMNSCPSSPRGDAPHFLNQSLNVAENLSAAASAIAVLEKRDGKFSGSDGIDSKPPYSYAQLIIQAISSAPKHQLTLSGIYAHITKHYPYYRTADKGWQNSIRHNLSLNRYFVKVPRSQEESGKGSFWRVDPASERKLVEQAWRKRRQRAVPCFCSSITSGVSTITRSAPVSPEHSNPMSPVSALRGSITSSQEDYSTVAGSDSDGKMQLVQFATRYAQSAPGSPASLRHGVVMTAVAENNPVESNKVTQHQAPVLPTTTIPLTDSNRSKVLWPLHQQITNQPVSQSQLAQAAIIKSEGNQSSSGDAPARTYNATVIESSQVSSASQVPSTTSVNLAAISSLTPQQQQQLLQQSLQHQVVMMPGQQHRIQQAIPINVSTIVASPNNLVTSGIPFVLPVNHHQQQQYIVRRASEDASNEPAAKRAKPGESESPNVKSSD